MKKTSLVDSTNIKSRNTKTFSEADIIPTIENIIETNKKFSSHSFHQIFLDKKPSSMLVKSLKEMSSHMVNL